MNKYEPVRIAVLVSGGGTNLQAVLNAQSANGLTHGRVSLVLSSAADAYALCRAREAGIEAVAVPRRECASQSEFEEKLLSYLQSRNIELIVLAGFMCILTENFTSRYKNRIINIHPALIPSFCGKGYYGLRVHKAALDYGVKITGATVHFVNEIPDGGKIIEQKAVRIHKNDTPESLQKRVMEEAEWIILPRAVENASKKILKGEL